MMDSDVLSKGQQDLVVALVKEAGAALLEFWPGAAQRDAGYELKIQSKKDGSFVTEADFASNRILVDGLKKLFPQMGIYSEELVPEAGLSEQEFVWIIDPLDGTKTFINGNDDFSVLLALCRGEDPIFSVMYFPARGQLAIGSSGGGAWLDGRRLRVSKNSEIGEHRLYLRNLTLPPQPCFYPRWMDSGMAFFNVCYGDFDGIILKIVSHQEWDLAAPALLLSESGALVTDELNQPIHFYCKPIRIRYLVASNGLVHDQLLALIPKA